MEASALHAPAALARRRLAGSPPLLRLRSDEQLVALFRAGSDDAFSVIHDRYRARLLAYTRQMVAGGAQDAEDMLQDVFVRAYRALRASDRPVSLRAWLYRVAHNRCVDELRRPAPPPPEVLGLLHPQSVDPLTEVDRRERMRRLVTDIQRLPAQQRSALLMRELDGLSYQELADALEVTIPAVKSLLVRARVGLAQAGEARDAACETVCHELACAHERGVRSSGLARRHLHDCEACRAYRSTLRSNSRSLAAFAPIVGPLGLLAKLGVGGGTAAAGSSAAAGSAAAGSAAATGGALSAGTLVSSSVVAIAATKVALVAAVAVAGASGITGGHRVPAHHRAPAAPVSSAVPVPIPAATARPVLGAGASTASPAASSARANGAHRRRDRPGHKGAPNPSGGAPDPTVAPDVNPGAGPTEPQAIDPGSLSTPAAGDPATAPSTDPSAGELALRDPQGDPLATGVIAPSADATTTGPQPGPATQILPAPTPAG